MNKEIVHNYFSYDDKKGEEWRLNGHLHREDGPARIYSNGTKQWYKHGVLHRENGPAVEAIYNTFYENCEKTVWYYNGQVHNNKGPAYIERWQSSEILKYFEYDKLHHLQGPALIIRYNYDGGRKKDKEDLDYYINGEYYPREKYYKVINTVKKCVNKMKKNLRKKYTKNIYNESKFCKDICSVIANYVI
jgi:hypothetical protein